MSTSRKLRILVSLCFRMQGKGGHESYNIGHVTEGKPGLIDMMNGALAVEQYAHHQGKKRFTSIPKHTKRASDEFWIDDAHVE
ncbi:hypothetical protein DUI87_07318 [Hirundo rustica rustica]|uniref:Uncharacterized protein n=1 Tax=Hirundo rustica rustica TaxID=333673 RepID=A0A3M0KPY5_HIRRU|nr:hypothetical protein DUI87_07318 [Hirundo rustica rustica]